MRLPTLRRLAQTLTSGWFRVPTEMLLVPMPPWLADTAAAAAAAELFAWPLRPTDEPVRLGIERPPFVVVLLVVVVAEADERVAGVGLLPVLWAGCLVLL